MMRLKVEIPKTAQDCKDGKCGHEHEHIIEIPEKSLPNATITDVTIPPKTDLPPIEKPKPEIKIETVIEDFKPNYECPDGNCPDLVHPNKNYRRKPKGKCNNCDQFTKNKDGKCPWCKGTDIEELDPEDLEELGISNPPEVEHNHE